MGRRRKYSEEFRAEALRRMAESPNVTALAQELGIRRKWLYQWRADAASAPKRSRRSVAPKPAPSPPPEPGERWKEMVAELTLENRFFAGALRRIEEARLRKGGPINAPSGRRSTARANNSTKGKAD